MFVVVVAEDAPDTDAVLHTAFHHPDFILSVDQLNDALDEERVEEAPDQLRLAVVLAGEYKARDGCRFVDQVPRPFFSMLRLMLWRTSAASLL